MLLSKELPNTYLVSLSGLRQYEYRLPCWYAKLPWLRMTVIVSLSGPWWRSWNMIMSGVIISNPVVHCQVGYRVGRWHVSRLTAKKIYKHVARIFEEHMSWITNTVYMLFRNCVTYDGIRRLHISGFRPRESNSVRLTVSLRTSRLDQTYIKLDVSLV